MGDADLSFDLLGDGEVIGIVTLHVQSLIFPCCRLAGCPGGLCVSRIPFRGGHESRSEPPDDLQV